MISLPKTAFSLLYNATGVSTYRREAHEDLRVTFERFGVTDGEIQEACTRMENAAYELRANSVDPGAQIPDPAVQRQYDAARLELDVATDLLFSKLVLDFAWFLSSYAELQDLTPYRAARSFDVTNWVQEQGLLLDLVYQSLYVPQFATEVVEQASLIASRNDVIDEDIITALRFVKHALTGSESVAAATALPYCKVLCDAMAREYKEHGYLECW